MYELVDGGSFHDTVHSKTDWFHTVLVFISIRRENNEYQQECTKQDQHKNISTQNMKEMRR